ncbi:MAG: ABC transporter ATP-binding protein [Bacilli bacterium]|nr:ABC transporter ATP-binding protein [Bacilli bacterium]
MIKLEHINKDYILSKDNKVSALKDISLEINKGEFVAIIGKSGSGKSTLLNLISCMDSRYSGNYYLYDELMNNKSKKELANIRNSKFGFIFQNFNLLNKMTGYENIEVPLIYKKVPKRKRNEIIENVAKDLGILDRLDHTPKELSGGEQQRVAIARALVTDPDIILADEPTGALDVKTGEQILNILEDLNNKGKTIIIVTHDLDLAKRCKRVISISDGKILSDKKGDEL